MPETLSTRVSRGTTGGLHAPIDRPHPRQTGVPATAHRTGLQQEAPVKEAHEPVRANQIAERLAPIKASTA